MHCTFIIDSTDSQNSQRCSATARTILLISIIAKRTVGAQAERTETAAKHHTTPFHPVSVNSQCYVKNIPTRGSRYSELLRSLPLPNHSRALNKPNQVCYRSVRTLLKPAARVWRSD